MTERAAITILRGREEVQRLWESQSHSSELEAATVTYKKAPGDRGTEIHVALETGGTLPGPLQRLRGAQPRAKAMDELRRFKQRVETGVIARSDGVPEGELAERKLKQRPAQPLSSSELEKVQI
jgi:uncharacterized membrane protein